MSLIVFITIVTVIALLIIILMIRTSIHRLNHSFMGTHQTALDIVQNHHRMMRTKQQLSHLRRVSDDDEGVESHIYPTTTSISSSASSAFRPFSETTSAQNGSGDESAMMAMMLRKRRGAMRVAGANEENEEVIANRENEIFSQENDFQDAEVENSEGDIRDQHVNDQPMITVDDYFTYCDDDDRHVHENKQSPAAAVLINRKRPSYTREIEDTEQRELKRRTEYRTRQFEKRLNETIGVKRGRRYPSLYPVATLPHEEEEHDTDAMNVEYYHDDGDDQSPPYEDEDLRYVEEGDDVNTEKRFKQTIADDSLNVEELSMSDEEGDEEHRDRLHDVTLNRDQASPPVEEEENEEMEPLASELNRSQTPESIENIHNEMRQMSETRAPARPIRSLFPIRRVISHQRLLAHPDDIKARISLPKKMMKVIDAQSSDINNLVDRTKEDTAPILEYVSLGDEQQSSQQTTSTTAPASTSRVTFAPSTTQPSISFSGLPASNTFQFGTNGTTQQRPQTQTQTQPLLDLKFTFTPNPDLPLSTTSVTTQPATSIQPAANTAINFGGVPPANTNTGVNEPKTPTKFTGGELFGFGTPFAK